jgi:hypothetical protein
MSFAVAALVSAAASVRTRNFRFPGSLIVKSLALSVFRRSSRLVPVAT